MSQYRCPECAYHYDETAGDPQQGYPPGTHWEALPDAFACPDCAVRGKADFEHLAQTPPHNN